MTDIEFSEWYFLFLTPSNNETGQADLTLNTRPSTARDVTENLSGKLKVQSSDFRIISIEEYEVRIYFNYVFNYVHSSIIHNIHISSILNIE